MGEAQEFEQRLKEVADRVTVALDQLIPPAGGPEANLMRAMRHAALANGKRMRPFFLLETGAMFDAPEKTLLRAAAALECVHCYSLVHDDLPCMDDDDFRRGQPTVHKAFDEATAVLAGDALLTLAFKILASTETHDDASVRAMLIERLADASGARGMVGGQMIDMLESDSPRDLNTITRMQRLKTGALISYATEAAAIVGRAREAERNALAGFSNDLGLAYQIADDLLDATGSEDSAGKPLRTDEAAGKANFVTILGIEGARQRVRILAAQAKEHLAIFREKAHILLQSVDFVLDRTH
ncbi:MAG: polyprenyl synthetase family protein [Hyphomonas sp.]|jgi:farnesyl diphosphate synthase|uniref:Octaprenyl diphosphate synthase / Dimethylallyltransferase / (2E,6E)-farnesyl diphosphate synthase / Geranylgeranyl diphosphate synthase n=1 Tax=hydrothermal vent metagenome TaxID=652676 RepID=A0A160U250_9ZZZZ|nr:MULTISPECIES: farnesyl diphosphate synthase [unclassified Hyphomonas]MBG66859.1 farnesyl-diphosphate synthase [Hyphomonas sp.]MBO6582686.1 polyprenyl synthetase family protein [Hyphomonas sp.]MDF1806820.1 polyprenyl synthetase family protein [Hyphomonas sp.]QSR21860.1 farnesyl-diphosphate synthase [Hyphomonas sp. KY3]|tara:strand:- start:7957 stop:8853 length:897 start_codon:yes stop_codon:yes gene_type:complete